MSRKFKSPSGEVLAIPDADGERVMRALGWVPVDPDPKPAKVDDEGKPAPVKRVSRNSKTKK